MTSKTNILIAVLFLITCGLLYLAITSTPLQKKTVPSPTPTPMSVNAKTTLSLVSTAASQSSQTTVAVNIDTTNNVNAVQLEFSYDPSKISNVTVTPGTFFTQPSILLKSIDQANGRISYALAEQLDLPGKSGKGTVALVSFTLTPGLRGTTTTIKLLPKTAATADKILESVLKETHDITLPLPVGSLTPTTSITPVPTK